MINKKVTMSGVSKQELDSLEGALKAYLENTHYWKDSGLRSDEGGPKYHYAYVKLEYGIKQVISSPTLAVWVNAKGQFKEGQFTLDLLVALPEDLYEQISSALDGAPTIQAGLGQSYAGK